MSDVDMEMVIYFRTNYGPFGFQRLDQSKKCDFCGQACDWVVELLPAKSSKRLYVCVACESLEELTTPEVAERFRQGQWIDTGGLQTISSKSEFQTALQEGKRLARVTALPKLTSTVQDLLQDAVVNKAAGYGKTWRIIPSILEQAGKGRNLSIKQRAVLQKFNQSCDKERGKDAKV